MCVSYDVAPDYAHNSSQSRYHVVTIIVIHGEANLRYIVQWDSSSLAAPLEGAPVVSDIRLTSVDFSNATIHGLLVS
jgi:hypothetical protein